MPRQSIIQTAAAELGTGENPTSSNKTKYGTWYGLNGFAWCAMFVSWVYDHAGHPLGHIEDDNGYRSCQGGYSFWKSKGMLTKAPQQGDIVIFDWNGDGHCDHTGIFDSWVKEGTTFRSYEGNTAVGNDSDGGSVMLRTRNAASVKAFVSVLEPNTQPTIVDDTLRKGDQGSRVATLQKMLYDLEYEIVVDGDYGSKTEKAIKQFQKDHHLTADGVATPVVCAQIELALRKPEVAASKVTDGVYIKKGATGAVVVAIQKALNKKAGNGDIDEDGVFGAQTVEALKRFQASAGLTADGLAGPQTIKALGVKNV